MTSSNAAMLPPAHNIIWPETALPGFQIDTKPGGSRTRVGIDVNTVIFQLFNGLVWGCMMGGALSALPSSSARWAS